jgi:hypothetical protein
LKNLEPSSGHMVSFHLQLPSAKLPSVVNPMMNLQVWRFILPVSGDSVCFLNIGFTTLQEIYSLQLWEIFQKVLLSPTKWLCQGIRVQPESIS